MLRRSPEGGWLGAIAGMEISVPAAIALAHIGERRHKRLATVAKNAFLAPHLLTGQNSGRIEAEIPQELEHQSVAYSSKVVVG